MLSGRKIVERIVPIKGIMWALANHPRILRRKSERCIHSGGTSKDEFEASKTVGKTNFIFVKPEEW